MSQRTPTRRRLLFSLLVTGAFFVLVEGGLWVVGGVVEAVAGARMPTEDPAGAPTLLCLGDSVTFGLGSDTDQAYPALLGEASPGLRVYNLGRPLVDLGPCMRAAEARGAPTFYQLDGVHLSPEGNAAMAACVGEGLE